MTNPAADPLPDRETIAIIGLDCEDCARTLAHGLKRVPGVLDAEVSAAAGSARIAFEPGRLDRDGLIDQIEAHGYRAGFTNGASNLLVFDLLGLDCADCAKSVESAVSGLGGVGTATVNFGAATLQVTPAAGAPGDMSRRIERIVDQAGFEARLRAAGSMSRVEAPRYWRDRRFLLVLAGFVAWAIGFAIEHGAGQELLADAVYLAALGLAGSRFVRAAWLSIRSRRIDMNVLMTVSAIGAAALGDWSEAALVIVLFALGSTLQAVTLDRTRSAVRALMDIVPPDARLVRGETEQIVPAASLQPDDLVRVRPGDRVPADGEIVEGFSSLDQQALTGESMPVDRSVGDEVYGGSVNGAGSLLVRVTKPAGESTVARIIDLVASAQASKSPSEQLVDRFAAWYTPLVVGIAALLAGGGALLSDDAGGWVYRALVLLVIACPCALVISTPVSIVSAIGAATRRGILVKGGEPLEQLARVRNVAFDKTGTLTRGRPAVGAVLPFHELAEHDLLSLAAGVEAFSEHPVGQAVVAHARREGLSLPVATGFTATPGRGVEASVDSRVIRIGAPEWVLTGELLERALDLAADGMTPFGVVEVRQDGARLPLGVIGVSDQVRPEAASAVAALKQAGFGRIVMLTGDHERAAAAVGRAVGVDEVRAGLLPEDKAAVVRELNDAGGVVMIGDGINDAPALALADVGIAMGRGGTDVALETAAIALMRDDVRGVAEAVQLARRTVAIIRQNVTISFAIKAVALLLGVAGFVNLWIAVAADMGASLLVTLNGLRLLRGAPRNHDHAPATTPVAESVARRGEAPL
jgi:Cd2+/Zn2+-exporting ATPase